MKGGFHHEGTKDSKKACMRKTINKLPASSVLIFFGALLSAIGAIQRTPVVTLVGALGAAVGAIWTAYDQSETKRKLNERISELIGLNQNLQDALDGGDSYCYLLPNPNEPETVSVWH